MEVPGIIRVYSSKVKKAYKSGGVSLLLKRSFRKTSQTIFRTNNAYWYAKDLTLPIPDIEPKIPAEIDWDFSNTVEWIKTNTVFSYAEEREIETAIKQNHYYPNVRYQGNIIGYIKVGYGEVYVMDFDKIVRFQNGTAYIYDVLTLPDFRGQGIAPFLVTEVMRFLKQRGYKRLLCHIPEWNTASASSFTKCSFERIKRIRYCKILGMECFSTRPENI